MDLKSLLFFVFTSTFDLFTRLRQKKALAYVSAFFYEICLTAGDGALLSVNR